MNDLSTAGDASGEQTLALLWERTRRQGDMPGFAKAVSAILGAMRGEEDNQFSMTETVLSDPVLTQKVLRLANSGMYSAFGQHVSTVSKAVLVLGTEAIGHLALGLKLIEELAGAGDGSGHAHIEMEKAVLAGLVARELAGTVRSAHTEEAVVCSMLHMLGRMMVTFYMPEAWARLQQHGGAGNEDAAAMPLLGISLSDIGRAAARRWGLPTNLVAGMATVDPVEDGAHVNPAEWVAALSTMARRCAELLWHDDEAGADALAHVTRDYAPMLGLDLDMAVTAIAQAREQASAELSIAPLSRPAERRARELARTRQRAAGNRLLTDGLVEMRDMVDNASPGQMVSIALETIYKGLDFSRAVAFVRNRREGYYAARMCLGESPAGAAQLKDQLGAMRFDDSYQPNVFHAALNSDRVIFIENARDPKFAAKLPQWWKSTLLDARSFVILPLTSNGQPAGFLYGDWDESFPPIALSQTEFALMNDVRALVMRAVEKRHHVEVLGSRAA